MNILFIDQFGEPGAGQLALLDIVEGVRPRGWNPAIAAPGFAFLRSDDDIATYPLALSAVHNGRKGPADFYRYSLDLGRVKAAIRAAAADHRADLVYVNGPRALPGALGLHVPTIFHTHNFINGVAAQWLTRYAIRRSAATVIAASKYVERQFQETAPSPVRGGYN